MTDNSMYDEWIANRQSIEPSPELTDRVMAAVSGEEPGTVSDAVEDGLPREHYVCLADRLNQSRPVRFVACATALLIGSVPFLYVAYVVQSPLF